MHRHLVIASILAVVGSAAAAAGPGARHPIVGTWTFDVPGGGCTETYYFRSDGTTLVTSAEEVAESRYEITTAPSEKGFYRLDDTLTADNGKKDCAGEIMKVGQKATNYVRFNPAGSLMLMCHDESFEACFGPLVRATGQDA